MSILKKLGLIEEVEEQQPQMSQEEIQSLLGIQSTPTVDFEVSENFLTIEKIYEKAGLSDTSKSIFKVDEFSKVLPDTLPTDAKRQSVIGILSASNLHLDSLLEDASSRLDALKGVASVTAENSLSDITDKEAQITKLLEEVDLLKQSIISRKSEQEKQNNVINEEVEKINQIVKFLG